MNSEPKTNLGPASPIDSPSSDVFGSGKYVFSTGIKRKTFSSAVLGLCALLMAGTLLVLKSDSLESVLDVSSYIRPHIRATRIDPNSFYSSVHTQDDEENPLCPGMYGKSVTRSGYIGLKGDSDASPKRSFFWLFEAQNGNPDAPLILTIGGGPGTSGMSNPLIGQSHCAMGPDGTVRPNPNAWTERNNLLALDHPIGVGFSYGTRVNNSRDAAHDVYDFFQKFFVLFPQFAKNKLVLASGSYGGTYVPHIATVIHQNNLAIAAGYGQPGAQHINLESMMVSNPYSDTISHYRWALQQRCKYTHLFNSTQCDQFYEELPFCLEALQYAYRKDTAESKVSALEACFKTQADRLQGRSYENVNDRCNGTIQDCIPELVTIGTFLNRTETKVRLGVSESMNYTSVNSVVTQEFFEAGDLVQPAYLMYEELLRAGYRLLHYIGKLDANCAWPGVVSFLRLLNSPYQAVFNQSPDLRWAHENATVRVVGPGAGNMTYILMDYAGHMVVKDQAALVKKVIDHWIANEPYETEAE